MKRNKKPEMITQIEKTPILEVACAKVGISRTTHYRWLQEDSMYAETVHKAMSEGQSRISDMAEAQLISLIREGSLGAIVYWLRHRHSAYANRLEITGQLEVEGPLTEEEKLLISQVDKITTIDPIEHEKHERSGDHPVDDSESTTAEDNHKA